MFIYFYLRAVYRRVVLAAKAFGIERVVRSKYTRSKCQIYSIYAILKRSYESLGICNAITGSCVVWKIPKLLGKFSLPFNVFI